MSTHDYVIDNQTAPNFRADLNNALLAIASNNSSATAPAVTYANMMWCDTAANILYMRNEDNDAWIRLGTLDQTADTFAAAVALASQAEAETGTDNTKVMTPLRTAQAIEALVPPADQDFVLLARAVLSNNATADFTAFDGANYDSYAFVFSDVMPSATTGSFNLQMSSNGGSTYDAASNSYYYAYDRNSGGTTNSGGGQSGTIPMAQTIVVNRSVSGILNVYAPHTSTENTKTDYIMAFQSGTTSFAIQNGGGVRNATVVVNGVRFFFNAANMLSGTITMYGKRNA